MKRIAAVWLALALMLGCVPALAENTGAYYSPTATLLSGLTHNCPNTGIMLPESFDPFQTTYLLTVADWVSRPVFTPVAFDPNAVITVNGKVVKSGQKSQVIPMTDKPQAVTITVSNGGAATTYTIYLQRRPSEKRTKVSAGYINSIYLKGTTWRMDADLVTIQYAGGDYESGNLSTFSNKTTETNVYDYPLNANCIFYYGTKENCYRARNVQEFMSNYLRYGSSLYSIIYIESEIVAVFPYGADY
ncbi:MAG: cadherin-like beta sandwich domain-containing protein [Clostridia bacterium]|nr:cadherin-like beta sandwich domain-containing protein [Clostridia bacterium]